MRRLDIAVAGCGPGGLAAALFLHRAGHRITLFERFDVPRPIGSGLILQPTGLAILDHLGLGTAARHAGAWIERLSGRAMPSGRIVLDVRYAALSGDANGIGMHRAMLFDLLFGAAQHEGLAIETSRPIADSEPAAGGRRALRFENGGGAGPFDLVVDALGTQSNLARQPVDPLAYGALWTTLDWATGFDPHALDQRYRKARRMAGVLPVGRMPGNMVQKAAFFWSLRRDALDDWRRSGLARWKAEVFDLWPATAPLLDQIDDPGQLTFARYSHRTFGRPAETGLIHIGDAWHSTSPQLGQGANMALLDAAALAACLETAGDVSAALDAYVGARRRHIRLYQAMSLLFTPVYQSDSRLLPLLRDHIAGPLSRIPPAPRVLASMVAGSIGAPLARIAAIGADRLPFLAGATKAPLA